MSDLQDNEKQQALSNSLYTSYNLGKQEKGQNETNDFNYFDISEYALEKGFVNCYLDRLTIVGNLPDKYIGAEEPFGTLPWKTLAIFVGGGWKAQVFPDRKQKLYLEFDPENAKKMRKRNFRVECNPNLLTHDQLKVLFNVIVPKLDKVGISRVDLAFDYERKLNDFVFDKNLSGGKFWDRSGNTQTIYYGSPKSSFRCRIYDKKAERLDKGSEEDKEEYSAYDTLWRLEYELTGSGYVENQVRKNFEVIENVKITKRNYNLKLDVELTPLEIMMIKAYDTDRDLFNQLNKNTKTKYKKLAEKISDVDLTDGLRTVFQQMQICSDKPMKINVTQFCKNVLNGKNPLPEE